MSAERPHLAPAVPGTRAPVVWAWRGDDQAVADFVSARIRPDRPFRAAVAGGRTPRPILARLAERSLAWNRVTVVPTDERLVHECFDVSNYGMLSRALDHTGANVERLGPDVGRLDLVWLGMASDGKVASLFDARDAGATASRVVRTEPPAGSDHVPHSRLSLSVPAMAAASEIILVIRGGQKRSVVEAAIDGQADLAVGKLLLAARSPVTIFWSPS